MTLGICSFAEWIPGVQSYQQGGVRARVGFCDHTAGGYLETMRHPSFWDDPKRRTSVHFAIGRDGHVIQIVNIFDTAWAEGSLNIPITWAPFKEMQRTTQTQNPNAWLISTEHEDVVSVEGKTVYVPGSQWTPAQYAADLAVKKWCREEVKRVMDVDVLHYGLDSLAGHHMFDPVSRAECPGRFWREEYRDRLFHDLTGSTEEVPMIRHNTVATKMQGAAAGNYRPDEFDFPPPASARMVRLELFLDRGSLQVNDGSGKYAGQIGWGGERYGVVDVDVSSGEFGLTGNGVLAQVGIVGYWS